MNIEDRLVAALHLLPRDSRLNKLVTEIAAKIGVPDINSVADLITALEEPAPALHIRPQINGIMVGGAITPAIKANLFLVCITFLYLCFLFGITVIAVDLLPSMIGGIPYFVGFPELIRYARNLFTERPLFVARQLIPNGWWIEAGPLVIVRLEFNFDTGFLNSEGEEYFTIVEDYDDSIGELPRLDGSIFFSVLQSNFNEAADAYRYTPRLVNGRIQTELPPTYMGFEFMMALKNRNHISYNFVEELNYADSVAHVPPPPPPPPPPPCIIRGDPPVDILTHEPIANGDILVNFRFGSRGQQTQLLTCGGRAPGIVVTQSSFNHPLYNRKKWLQDDIDRTSIQLVTAVLEQAGGRRKSRAGRKIRRRTIRRRR